MSGNLENSIIEVSLIGTGGGYGESVVLNLGNNDWIVVDSCQDPYSKKSLPLEYLKNLGVNVSQDVKLVICTHWHDDHILGLSELLVECDSANLCMASATDRKKFLLMLGLDYQKVDNDSSASSTKELNTCIEIIRSRKAKIISAVQDRMVFSQNKNEINSQVYSLTPSDFILEQFNYEISFLMRDHISSNRKFFSESPNDKSVAIYIKVNDQRILLGSDLEVSEDDKKGWLCILENCNCIDSKASVFKIPHHGSKNGFHKRIWDEIIASNAIAKLTPWNRGGKLPSKEMLEQYASYTNSLFMTSSLARRKKPKKRDRRLAKAIDRFNKTVCEEKFDIGIVSCRYDFTKKEGWDIELIDNAFKITDEIISQNKF